MWFWLFVVLGGLTLMAALYGGAAAWTVRRPLVGMHALAILLLAAAWYLEHGTALGRACLVLAFAVELAAAVAVRVKTGEAPGVSGRSSHEETAPPAPLPGFVAEAVEASAGEARQSIECGTNSAHAGVVTTHPAAPHPLMGPDVAPALDPDRQKVAESERATAPTDEQAPRSVESDSISSGADFGRAEPDSSRVRDAELAAPGSGAVCEAPRVSRRTFSTIVLFDRPLTLTPTVFLASLRRAGQRGATMAQSSRADVLAVVEAGAVTLRLTGGTGPCAAPELDAALDAAIDWPEARAVVASHQAHALLISDCDANAPPDAIVRLHHRAHAALMEFAAVAAVLWPAAERLDPPETLPKLAAQAGDEGRSMAATCTTLRRFELDGENAGLVLIDSLGLAAFGLPDVQMIARQPLDAEIAAPAIEVIERLLTTGDAAAEIDLAAQGGRDWGLSRMRSAFAPDREVVQVSKRAGRGDS